MKRNFIAIIFAIVSVGNLFSEMTVNTDQLSNTGIIKLDGKWDFYWNRLLSPEEVKLPGVEPDNKFEMTFWNDKGYSPYGVATYQLILNLEGDNTPSTLGLEMYSIYSAYRLYINGKLIASEGELGLSADTEKSRSPRTSVFFGHDQDRLDIIFQVSNHHYIYCGGVGGPPVLGSAKTISNRKIIKTGSNLFMVAAFLFMGLYHIALFLFRSKDRASLYLGLFSLTLCFRSFLITGEKVAFDLLPWLNVPIFNSLQNLGIFPLLPLFMLYITHLFKKEKKQILNTVFIGASIILLIVSYIKLGYNLDLESGKTALTFDILKIYNPIIICGLLYIFYVLVKAISHKRHESSLIAAGFGFIFLVSLNDILFNLNVINTNYYLGIGFLVFLFIQTLILARRFSRAFSKVESQSRTLKQQQKQIEEMNQDLEQKIQKRTNELEERNSNILYSTQYAKIIQTSILPKPEVLSLYLKKQFVIWKPRDIVGGDFYWFEPLDNGFLLAVIDCTGHGVPGALMTMSATTVLRQVVSYVDKDDPGQILDESNKILRNLLNQQSRDAKSNDGFDIGLCYYNFSERSLTFAGANIPLIILRNGICNRIKADRQGIGFPRSKEDYRYTNNSVHLESGDTLYLSSNGFVNQLGGEHGYSLGWTKFFKILEKMDGVPLDEQKDLIIQDFTKYQNGEPQIDDITLLGFKIE
ncbi:MAG: SpoIIE family protein phosphatase [Spirochaetaceae bacterium]